MARRQICALLLVAAASADVNETAASESRVRALAGQSYDWLADRAPAAKAFAAQAAAQHGPGFVGSRGSCRGPTPPWWTRSRDAGLFAEFCCCSFDSSPFPPPCLL